jgi:hypothetical protein
MHIASPACRVFERKVQVTVKAQYINVFKQALRPAIRLSAVVFGLSFQAAKPIFVSVAALVNGLLPGRVMAGLGRNR